MNNLLIDLNILKQEQMNKTIGLNRSDCVTLLVIGIKDISSAYDT